MPPVYEGYRCEDALTTRTRRQDAAKIQQFLRIAWVSMLALVVVGSILPDSSLPVRALARVHVSDKLLHFAAYYVLAALPALHESKRVLFVIVVVLLGLGVGLEFAQIYSRGRSFEVADMLAGGCGVMVGLLLRFVVAARGSGEFSGEQINR